MLMFRLSLMCLVYKFPNPRSHHNWCLQLYMFYAFLIMRCNYPWSSWYNSQRHRELNTQQLKQLNYCIKKLLLPWTLWDSSMDILPDELWLRIFGLLDGEALKSVEKVCEGFADLLSDELFWFSKCLRSK